MGLDYNGVGNHEFDEGVDELLRMQNGGCHPSTAARTATGSPAPTSSSSPRMSTYKDSGETIFPPYAIREFAASRSASSA